MKLEYKRRERALMIVTLRKLIPVMSFDDIAKKIGISTNALYVWMSRNKKLMDEYEKLFRNDITVLNFLEKMNEYEVRIKRLENGRNGGNNK